MQQWFLQLQPRERYTLIIGIFALILILLYFLVWEPLLINRQRLENIVSAQQKTLSWMQQAAKEAQQLRMQVPSAVLQSSSPSLLSVIDQTMRHSGLTKVKKEIEPSDAKTVRVRFAEVTFSSFINWLGRLEDQHQVYVQTISITKSNTPGIVKAHVTLSQKTAGN